MKKERYSDRGMTFLFLGFLGIVSLAGMITPQKAFSDSENRYLQKKPEFTVKSLLDGSYGEKYEQYLSDQFPGRNGWIGLKVTSERLAFQEDVNGVYFGKDGYLIEKYDTEDVEGEQLNKNMEKLAAFTGAAEKSLGKDHVRVMLVPSASQVMTDRLPFLAAPYDQGRVTELLFERLKEAGNSPEMVLPAEDCLKSFRDEELYYRTDTIGPPEGRFWDTGCGRSPWGLSRGRKTCLISGRPAASFMERSIPNSMFRGGTIPSRCGSRRSRRITGCLSTGNRRNMIPSTFLMH